MKSLLQNNEVIATMETICELSESEKIRVKIESDNKAFLGFFEAELVESYYNEETSCLTIQVSLDGIGFIDFRCNKLEGYMDNYEDKCQFSLNLDGVSVTFVC